LIDEPVYECLTVVVVDPTVALHAKVYVSEAGYLFKKHMLPFLLNDRFVF
jgi:hypothetical protein